MGIVSFKSQLMSHKYLFLVILMIFCSNANAQKFRGIVSVKVYAEKGKIKVLAPFNEEFDDGIINPSLISTREVDTSYHAYYVCSDTVFHIKHHDSESAVAESAQIGPDFYLASSSARNGDYYFKFRAQSSQLERANNSEWKQPKKKYRKQGYNSYWELPLNPAYSFESIIDTSATFGWMGHDQGLLNHLFPVKGIHRKIREDRKDAVWIHEYSYEIIESLSCDSLFETFQV